MFAEKSVADPTKLCAETIPTSLRSLPHWVVFRITTTPKGRLGKTPLIPGTDIKASSTNPTTWRTFDVALTDVAERGPGPFANDDDGHPILGYAPGIAITAEMGITLIDIDGQDDHPLITDLDSYSERSISGNGIHILVKGHPPANATKPKGVEVYPGKRFLLITGNIIDGRDTIEDRCDRLAHLFPPPLTRVNPQRGVPTTLDDEDILRRARSARNGAKFDRLWSGDLSEYNSDHHRADQALCSLISFWTQDTDQIDRLFRESALYRDKWERKDYREDTIDRALSRPDFYALKTSPVVGKPHDAASGGDPCTTERDTIAELRATIAWQAAEIERLNRKVATLESVQSAGSRIVANKSLGPSRITAATIATQLAWRATATETPPKERGIDVPVGMMAITVSEIAERAGISENTAGSHLKSLKEQGFIRRETRTVRHDVDERTGEILDTPLFITQHFIGPATTGPLTPQGAIDLATTLAGYATERIEKRGGTRTPRCPDHPDADVIREVTDRCSVTTCRRVLKTETFPLPAMLLEPKAIETPPERNPNFGDHYRSVDDVLLATKVGDRSATSRNPNFGDRSREPFQEPAWLADAPDFAPDDEDILIESPHSVGIGARVRVGDRDVARPAPLFATAPAVDHPTDVSYGARW